MGVEDTVMGEYGVGVQGTYHQPLTFHRKGARMTHNYTYDQMYRAADKLWPGEAEFILANPTDEQLQLIIDHLHRNGSSPVEGWSNTMGRVVTTGNVVSNPTRKFRIGVGT